jgi:hypothetical protein
MHNSFLLYTTICSLELKRRTFQTRNIFSQISKKTFASCSNPQQWCLDMWSRQLAWWHKQSTLWRHGFFIRWLLFNFNITFITLTCCKCMYPTKLISTCPFTKKCLVHVLSIPLMNNAHSFWLNNKSSVRYLCALMCYIIHTFSTLLINVHIIIEAISIPIFGHIRSKQLLHLLFLKVFI